MYFPLYRRQLFKESLRQKAERGTYLSSGINCRGKTQTEKRLTKYAAAYESWAGTQNA